MGPPGPEDTTWTEQRERVCIGARQYEQTIDMNTSISGMAL